MQNERSRAIYIKTLQAIADAQHWLAKMVSVFEQQIVHCIASRVRRCRMSRSRGLEPCWINIGLASRQKHAIAALYQLSDFVGSLIDAHANRFPSGQFDRALVL